LTQQDQQDLYDPEAIYHQNGPIDPRVMEEAVTTIMRGVAADLLDTPANTGCRMFAAMRALAALNPRNEPELMIGVQILSAYHAANAAWHRATIRPHQDDTRRHVATAATATRLFDTMLRALERRQAKPLAIPVGRPPSKTWTPVNLEALQQEWQQRCGLNHEDPDLDQQRDKMNDDELVSSWAAQGQRWLQYPNEGLDIANTPNILPDGGMLVPWNPTPAQEAYMERRLILFYLREQAENRRNGSCAPIKVRPTRPGDLIP
jgi:hypothetical protein